MTRVRALVALVAVLMLGTAPTLMALQQRTIQSRLYQPGSRTFDIPPGQQKKFIGIHIELTREAWPLGVDYVLSDGTVQTNVAVAIRFQRTLDNGQTWLEAGAATFPGGVIFRRDGTEFLTSSAGFQWVLNGVPIAQDGDVRVIVENTVPVRTAVTLTMTEPGD